MQYWDPRTVPNASNARSIALEVAHRLQRTRSQEDEPYDASLARGDAGLAVLFGHFDRCFPNDGWDKVAHEAVLRINQNLSPSSPSPIGLFGGLAGLAFATWYLSRGGTRYRRARLAIDDVLLTRADVQANSVARKSGMPVEDFDLISGLSGVAAYLLCRVSDNRALLTLRTIIAALVEIVERDGPVPAWFTPADLISSKYMVGKYPEGNLNCGLAHGMPGMLGVLALAYRESIMVPGLRSAIERLANWLNAQGMADRWGKSWPAAVAVGAPGDLIPAPIAWCYGNPGIARALWLAGTALDDSSLCESALEAIRSVYRRPLARRGISSPTFCHGTAGLLQITMRFASETVLPVFSDAASTILEELVRSFADDTAYGYRAIDSDRRLVDNAGLLDGAAGVALVLLAATSDQEPSWDRIFLLS
jgi:lantibiotic biosynthesis protein